MGHELRFGILILQQDPRLAILERAQRYESAGFDTVWVADSFVDPWEPSRPWFECPIQRPRPPLSIAANGPKMVQLAARHADTWITEGAYAELWNTGATFEDVVRVTRERAELLEQTATELGREPAAIRRAFLFGYSPAEDKPWQSVETFREYLGTFTALGFSEFTFPEPSDSEAAVFERVVTELVGT